MSIAAVTRVVAEAVEGLLAALVRRRRSPGIPSRGAVDLPVLMLASIVDLADGLAPSRTR
jgi:hypothetical protein